MNGKSERNPGPDAGCEVIQIRLTNAKKVKLRKMAEKSSSGTITDLMREKIIKARRRDKCVVCSDNKRNSSILCGVEDPLDIVALEKTEGFKLQYHVLQRALSLIDGFGPDDITILELEERVKKDQINEIIVATNPSIEGDTTTLYIRQRLQKYPVKLTRLACGLPMGGDMEYTDQSTLLRALLASIQGAKSSGVRLGKERTRLVRSPLGSITMAGIPCKAASSSNPTHKPVLPEPVMPVTIAWVVRSGGSYVKRSFVILFFLRSNILPR